MTGGLYRQEVLYDRWSLHVCRRSFMAGGLSWQKVDTLWQVVPTGRR